MPRAVDIGLSGIDLGGEDLERLASIAEEAAMRVLARHGRRVAEASVTISVENSDGTLRVIVDVNAGGPGLGPLSYDSLVEEAVEAAFSAVEEELRRLARQHGEGGDTPRQG